MASFKNRFDRLDDRLEKVDDRVGGIETRLEGVEHRFGSVEGRLGTLAQKVDGLSASYRRTTRELSEFRSEMNERLDALFPDGPTQA